MIFHIVVVAGFGYSDHVHRRTSRGYIRHTRHSDADAMMVEEVAAVVVVGTVFAVVVVVVDVVVG